MRGSDKMASVGKTGIGRLDSGPRPPTAAGCFRMIPPSPNTCANGRRKMEKAIIGKTDRKCLQSRKWGGRVDIASVSFRQYPRPIGRGGFGN